MEREKYGWLEMLIRLLANLKTKDNDMLKKNTSLRDLKLPDLDLNVKKPKVIK